MKRITRTMRTSRHTGVEERVWIDKDGHWTRNESLAHAFDDAEAAKRVKRIPHAETENVPDAKPE